METMLVTLVCGLVAATAAAATRTRDLFGLMVMLSAYSGLLAVLFALLGAPDVAFTEAVVGSAVSTLFMMGLIRQVDPGDVTNRAPRHQIGALVLALAAAGVLLYGVWHLPPFGSPEAPPMQRVSPYYTAHAVKDAHTPNVVTAVLADYRSLDTLIETAVVVTAGLGVGLILRRS